MAKRMQEQKGEERSGAKSKSTAMNLFFLMFRQVPQPRKGQLHPKVRVVLIATGKPEKQDEKKFKVRRNVEFSSATARCIRWRGGLMDIATEKPVATKEESGDVDVSESETGS